MAAQASTVNQFEKFLLRLDKTFAAYCRDDTQIPLTINANASA